jgi:co-chaperonin GroES (HSP10)
MPKNSSIGRTAGAGARSGRGNHAAREVRSRVLPKPQGPEAHDAMNRPQWQPLKDRILLRRIEEPNSSVIMSPDKYWNPTAFKQSAHLGEVLAIGPKVQDVKVEEVVAFGRFTDWDVDGDCIIQEADVIFKTSKLVSIGIAKFTHNETGVDRFQGSLEQRYEETMHG